MATPFNDHPGYEPRAVSTLHEGSSEEEACPLYTLGSHASVRPDVLPYDFKRPDRISPDQLKLFAAMHDRFAKEYASQLTGLGRMAVDIEIESSEQLNYGEFVARLGDTTCLATVKAPELGGYLVLELSPCICIPLIERLLGGNVEEPVIPGRALTTIELRMVRSVLHRAMKPLQEAWSGLEAVNFMIETIESNPENAQVFSPNEVVLALRYRVGFAGGVGTMNLCLPYAMVVKRISELGSSPWPAGSPGIEPVEGLKSVQERLGEASVDVSAVLATTTITLSELQSMQPGDIILTDVSTTDPATLCVEGRPKFQAIQGQYTGHRAVQVVDVVQPGRSQEA